MALFYRREIQARIDEAAKFLATAQLNALVIRLNRPNSAAIEAEWELMWLTSLARIGTLQHEPKFSGASRFPDVHLRVDSTEFVADVATVSDAGYEDENPIRILRSELNRLYRKHNVSGGFALSIQSRMEGKPRDQKVRLLLPTRQEILSFVRRNFEPFVRTVSQNPEQPLVHRAPVPNGGVVQVDYNPKRRPYNHDGGHLSFDVPYSLTRNPVFNALKAKKRQLAAVGFSGMNGIILCDGDCSALCRTLYSATSYTIHNIVWEFLRQNTSIDFVLTVGVKAHHNVFGLSHTQLSFESKFYAQRSLGTNQREVLNEVLNSGIQNLPNLHRTPLNARYHLEAGSPPSAKRGDYFGWFSVTLGLPMQSAEIKLSARTLMSLLGGSLDLKEFREAHRIASDNGNPPLEPLRRMIEEGRRLESVKFEPKPGEDDDLVILCFGPLDPAAVKFHLPDKV